MDTDSMLIDQDGDGEQAKKKNLIVVLMVGAPGSGKTTFCNDVMAAGRRPWARICQDNIANGKAGTKLQCLASAATALKDGKSIFIDRCNLEKEQRADFLKLTGPHADLHAVVLDLPARLCISRSVKRTGHEGNLQGGKAAAVVNRMLQKKELPKLSEGFSRITICQNENDVKDAVNTYNVLGPSDALPAGIFGQKSPDAKVQVGIMRFMKKVNNLDQESSEKSLATDGKNSQHYDASQNVSNNPCSTNLGDKNKENDSSKPTNPTAEFCGVDIFCNDVHTLAFPSISTSDFQFDYEKASEIIIESVSDFLEKFENVRLILVDLSHKSKILSLVKEKATRKNIDSNKFTTLVGDITQLYTKGGLCCNAIANAANRRLKPGGGGVNAAIFGAAGEAFETATKKQADTLTPGTSVAVPLPSTSPLYLRERLTHVIHVLGPNMNPLRPDCLHGDYIKGCKVLRDAYSSLFNSFATIFKSSRKKESGEGSRSRFSDSADRLTDKTSNASTDNEQKIKRESSYYSASNKKCKGIPSDTTSRESIRALHGHGVEFEKSENYTDASVSCQNARSLLSDAEVDDKIIKNKKIAEATKKSWGAWSQTLHDIAMHPEKYKDAVLETTDDIVVLNDQYPKAKKHILVLSRLQGLDCLADVREEHLPLLENMHSAGVKWGVKVSREDSSLSFRLGYHSIPSMRQLHLHVISQDFDSQHMKNKKHWNSFTTAFFRDSSDVTTEIKEYGVANINDDEKLLKMELRCHKCRSAHPTIPKLKSHVMNCKFPLPSHLI